MRACRLQLAETEQQRVVATQQLSTVEQKLVDSEKQRSLAEQQRSEATQQLSAVELKLEDSEKQRSLAEQQRVEAVEAADALKQARAVDVAAAERKVWLRPCSLQRVGGGGGRALRAQPKEVGREKGGGCTTHVRVCLWGCCASKGTPPGWPTP